MIFRPIPAFGLRRASCNSTVPVSARFGGNHPGHLDTAPASRPRLAAATRRGWSMKTAARTPTPISLHFCRCRRGAGSILVFQGWAPCRDAFSRKLITPRSLQSDGTPTTSPRAQHSPCTPHHHAIHTKAPPRALLLTLLCPSSDPRSRAPSPTPSPSLSATSRNKHKQQHHQQAHQWGQRDPKRRTKLPELRRQFAVLEQRMEEAERLISLRPTTCHS